MSSKVGLLLSMIFIALFFLFGADLISLQSAYTILDSKANNISYIISRNGVIDNQFISDIENSFSVTFDCPINLSPSFGERITYKVSTTYKPLVISKNEMTITIQRMTIVGFYG